MITETGREKDRDQDNRPINMTRQANQTTTETGQGETRQTQGTDRGDRKDNKTRRTDRLQQETQMIRYRDETRNRLDTKAN